MPNQPKTGGKNIRIADDLWDRALAVAHRRGETLSQVIRAALVRYVKRHEKHTP
jgi:predicted transcriptional regulator